MASDVRTYKRADSAVFFKTREANGELSNMRSGYPLLIGEVKVPSSEALYQACRFPHLPEVQAKIIAQSSPMTAKMVAKPHRAQTREDWDEIRVAVMKWCLRIKLLQHWEDFGCALLMTDDRPIVEESRKDSFWGAIPDATGQVLRGTNALGRLLMELRGLLKATPSQLRTVRPISIDRFCLLGRPIEILKAKTEIDHSLRLVKSDLFEDRYLASRKAAPEVQQLTMFEHQPRGKDQGIKTRNYHVVASPRGGWDLCREGGKRASAHFKTKAEAMDSGRALARMHAVKLITHTKEASRTRELGQARI